MGNLLGGQPPRLPPGLCPPQVVVQLLLPASLRLGIRALRPQQRPPPRPPPARLCGKLCLPFLASPIHPPGVYRGEIYKAPIIAVTFSGSQDVQNNLLPCSLSSGQAGPLGAPASCQALSHLRTFALALPSTWSALPPSNLICLASFYPLDPCSDSL